MFLLTQKLIHLSPSGPAIFQKTTRAAMQNESITPVPRVPGEAGTPPADPPGSDRRPYRPLSAPTTPAAGRRPRPRRTADCRCSGYQDGGRSGSGRSNARGKRGAEPRHPVGCPGCSCRVSRASRSDRWIRTSRVRVDLGVMEEIGEEKEEMIDCQALPLLVLLLDEHPDRQGVVPCLHGHCHRIPPLFDDRRLLPLGQDGLIDDLLTGKVRVPKGKPFNL